MNILELRGVTKIFRDFWMRPRVNAVNDLSLSIQQGEVFGLLGPNGSGKSTTIKMILGLLHPTRGQIAVLGKPPTDVELKSKIGYLPEDSNLYRFLNARETLDFYARLFKIDGVERAKRIDMLIEMVGLSAAQYRPVSEYSKGMQRRIGLAQALINDPDFLILDEPTTGMDPLGTRQIKDLILTLKKRGKTILLCTHLLNEVEDVCDRLAIMYGGKKMQEGEVNSLLTVKETQVIESKPLKAHTLNRLREIIIQEEGPDTDVKVEQPRQRLEHLFLQVVEDAKKAGLQTSGAQSGAAVAEFLRADEGDALLSSLAAKPMEKVEVVAQPEPVRPREADAMLESLTTNAPSTPTTPASPAPTQSAPAATTTQQPAPPRQDVNSNLLDDLLKK
jgi:ABC-2 type transport system ATP-binding protein